MRSLLLITMTSLSILGSLEATAQKKQTPKAPSCLSQGLVLSGELTSSRMNRQTKKVESFQSNEAIPPSIAKDSSYYTRIYFHKTDKSPAPNTVDVKVFVVENGKSTLRQEVKEHQIATGTLGSIDSLDLIAVEPGSLARFEVYSKNKLFCIHSLKLGGTD